MEQRAGNERSFLGRHRVIGYTMGFPLFVRIVGIRMAEKLKCLSGQKEEKDRSFDASNMEGKTGIGGVVTWSG